MKKLCSFSCVLFLNVLLLVAGPKALAQAPAWQTAMGFVGYGAVRAMATSPNGDVYLVGDFANTAALVPMVL
jgi:hypothetical protein